MNIDISGRHFTLTEEIKTHVREKLSVMERFYDGIDDIHVILEISAGTSRSHVQLRGDKIKLDARASSHDMYAAFDETVGSLERQLRRFKDRIHGHPHRQGAGAAHTAGSLPAGLWAPAENSGLTGPVRIEDPSALPVLSTDAAMTEFELRGGDVLLFQNIETESVSAVYRDRSGGTRVVELRAEA